MEYVEPIRSRETLEATKAWLRSRSLRDYALFTAGVNFALRISDLLGLRVGDVISEAAHEHPDIRAGLNLRQAKTSHRVKVDIPPSAADALATYLREEHPSPWNPDAPLFPSSRRDRSGDLQPLDRTQAYRIINRAVRQFEPDLAVGTHTLRKTWGWFAFQERIPLEVIMRKLGHQAPSVTLRYLGITDDHVREASCALNL